MKKYMFFFILVFSFLLLGIHTSATGFGVGPNKKGERPNVDDPIIINNNGYCIGKDDNRIYLTFDCGYENGYTEAILDTLQQTDTKAIFFITGHYLKSSKDIVKRMIDEGHIIGNHTYSHKDFTKSTSTEILSDLKRLEDAFYDEFQIPMSKYVRPPRGEYNQMSQETLKNNGYTSLFWSLAYVDWNKDVYHGNHFSYDKVVSRIHNGAILLMHTVGKDNMMDLKDIIIELKAQGFIFSSVDEL